MVVGGGGCIADGIAIGVVLRGGTSVGRGGCLLYWFLRSGGVCVSSGARDTASTDQRGAGSVRGYCLRPVRESGRCDHWESTWCQGDERNGLFRGLGRWRYERPSLVGSAYFFF